MTAESVGLARPGHALVCAVTDRSRLHARALPGLDGLIARLGEAARAGVDFLQIREPDLSGRDLLALAGRVLDVTEGTGARVLVNDRLDVALASGAHGVHLKGESIETRLVRSLVPDGFLVGRSVHSRDEAERAAQDGADYVIVGTVYATASKAGRDPAGLDLLRGCVARCPVPVLAIGGMTVERAGEVAAAGAAGLAAIGLFMGADGPAEQVRRTLETTVAGIRRAFAPADDEDRVWP